jgi:hypothetical protein|tara:strand:- start:7322 stop:7558 length:237 start_codon:yes stop_codon:yes gene_type:complete
MARNVFKKLKDEKLRNIEKAEQEIKEEIKEELAEEDEDQKDSPMMQIREIEISLPLINDKLNHLIDLCTKIAEAAEIE